MPISRPLLIVLIAAIVALGGFYATQGSRQSTDAPTAAAPEPTAQPEPTAKAKPQADAAKADAAKGDAAKPDATKQPVQIAKAERPAAKAERSQAKAERKRRVAATTGPAAVKRAIRADKTVVLYFYGPESADDAATGRAVAALKGKRGVAVFKAPIGRLTAYRDLIGQLGIAQAPAVVIVGRRDAARVIEGYVDPPTLAQDVADAR